MFRSEPQPFCVWGATPLMFWCRWRLSLSLFVTSLAPGLRTSRECERKNILQGLAALACDHGLLGQSPRANGLQTIDTSFSQFCQLEVRGQEAAWAEVLRVTLFRVSDCRPLPVSSPGGAWGTQAPQDSGGHSSHSWGPCSHHLP